MYSYTPAAAESDDELRKRIVYVADDGGNQRFARELAHAAGSQLDDIASRYNLRRRQ